MKGTKSSKNRTATLGMVYPGFTVNLLSLSLDRSPKQMMPKKLQCSYTKLHLIPIQIEFYNLKQFYFRSTQDITKD